jgi:molybdate transport system substrate-binding protein
VKRPLVALFLVLALAAVSHAQQAELTVSAAASLTESLNEIKILFEQARPGTVLVMNYAASGPLLAQIRQGAPVDVFASANQKFMNQAADANLVVPSTRRDIAANDLVLAVPADNPAAVKTLDDLKSGQVKRIGVGTPESVPAGQYAKTALTKAGLWDPLSPKLIFGESVRQVLDYLRRGEVEAGFVYATDARQAGAAVAVAAVVPADLLGEPVTYPVAVVAASTRKDLAAQFVEFLTTDQAKAVLKAKGFRIP